MSCGNIIKSFGNENLPERTIIISLGDNLKSDDNIHANFVFNLNIIIILLQKHIYEKYLFEWNN